MRHFRAFCRSRICLQQRSLVTDTRGYIFLSPVLGRALSRASSPDHSSLPLSALVQLPARLLSCLSLPPPCQSSIKSAHTESLSHPVLPKWHAVPLLFSSHSCRSQSCCVTTARHGPQPSSLRRGRLREFGSPLQGVKRARPGPESSPTYLGKLAPSPRLFLPPGSQIC